jgi:Glyoxalase-like domain
MHKSKLCGFIIDCQTENLPQSARFWGGALGMEVQSLPKEEGEKYVRLLDPTEQLHIEVQKVSHASRVHLDIETDNIEAEVKRLEKLGAKRISDIYTWVVMEAPTGQRFCVVRQSSKRFDQDANVWD